MLLQLWSHTILDSKNLDVAVKITITLIFIFFKILFRSSDEEESGHNWLRSEGITEWPHVTWPSIRKGDH